MATTWEKNRGLRRKILGDIDAGIRTKRHHTIPMREEGRPAAYTDEAIAARAAKAKDKKD